MVKVHSLTLVGEIMMVNGRMGKNMVKAHILFLMEVNLKVNSGMVNGGMEQNMTKTET